MQKNPDTPVVREPPSFRPTPKATAALQLPAQMRQAHIVEFVHKRGFVSVPSVAQELFVSEMTIRRDLKELEKTGRLVRTHGGAMAPEGAVASVLDRDQMAFDTRLNMNREGKEWIAAAAADLVESNRTVALDVGTTAYLLAAHLLARSNLMIFTSSLRVALLMNPGSNEIFIPGGEVRRGEMSISGPTAIAQFDKLWFDIAFIGVAGLTGDGIFDYSPEDSEVKRIYISRSTRKVVLCDSSKIGRMSLVQVAKLDDIDVLVTDREPSRDIMNSLTAANVEVQVAPELPVGVI
jgi:DeoR/GlpR family transcriptional regulator of sugar metabolism